MSKVITNGKLTIGIRHFPDRKRPALCVEEGHGCVVVGYIRDDWQADWFMDKLAELVGLKGERND